MDTLKQVLLAAEDEILVGMSNKGIVKRAYKDLEKEQPEICWKENEAKVTFSDAVCKISIPLEESTCSCPSRSMCRHRIAAILWLKRECADGSDKPFSKEELAAKREAVPDKKQEEEPKKKPKTEKKIDEAQASVLAAAWKENLILQLSTGLTRLSKETEESLERLAVLSHGAGFASLEKEARETGSLYGQYFSRAAVFRTEYLMAKIIRLYGLTEILEKTRNQEELGALAGKFRDAYEGAGELSLMGMGSRNFQSQRGYEGEIYYFLDTKEGNWYTWTDARPVFYEGRRRPAGNAGRQAVPWELNCSREQLTEMEIHLTNAKAAKGNRLSVSQETRGEIIGSRSLDNVVFTEKTVWDYRQLLEQYFSKPLEEQDETDHLALVGAARCGKAFFDQVEQRFFLPLYDAAGHRLAISLRYSKEEKYTIQVLERLQKRLQEREEQAFAFFGRLYLEKGALVLYPIEFFDKADTLKNDEIHGQVWLQTESNESEADAGILQQFVDYLNQVEQILSDLFQSGLDSVLEETVQGMVQLGKEGESLGLHLAGEKLTAMAEALQTKRHQMCFSPEEVVSTWAVLEEYLTDCRELIARDTAYLAMKPEDENAKEEQVI